MIPQFTLRPGRKSPAIGIAYCGYVPELLHSHGQLVDYVEVPFELLQHDPSVLNISLLKPIVLHCASLSVAGHVAPTSSTIGCIRDWVVQTKTPWLGEHLSFITADRLAAGALADEYAPGQPYNIGYTVAPPMNAETVDTVVSAMSRLAEQFPVPLILENPPLYFVPPGSTISQAELICQVCSQSDTSLLLDLAHLFITSQTTAIEPQSLLVSLPLNRVVEVHISGVNMEDGIHWDNHASRAPNVLFSLLRLLKRESFPKAVTLEYNWSARLPIHEVVRELEKVRNVFS